MGWPQTGPAWVGALALHVLYVTGVGQFQGNYYALSHPLLEECTPGTLTYTIEPTTPHTVVAPGVLRLDAPADGVYEINGIDGNFCQVQTLVEVGAPVETFIKVPKPVRSPKPGR